MLNISIVTLLITNFVPILGVIFFGWNLSGILFLYWFENLTIGFFTIKKILLVPPPNKNEEFDMVGATNEFRLKGLLAMFFAVHYGTFTIVHGIFLFVLLMGNLRLDVSLLLGVVSTFLSHGISYYTNYIGKKEFERESAVTLMFSPYGRVIVMHATVLMGSYVISAMGSSLGMLITLIFVKSVIDLVAHNIQHTGKRTYTVNPALFKAIPGLNNYLGNAFHTSVKTGEWEKLKTRIDPKIASEIEDYWSKHSHTS